MFEDVSWMVLVVLAMVAFTKYRDGQLGDWLRAKFLNAGQPSLPLGELPDAAGSSSSPSAAPAGFFASLTSTLLGRPLAGVADPTDPDQLYGTSRGRPHNGVDWPASTGTPVRASAGGRVRVAGAAGTYGLAVYIDHGNGLETRYAHLSSVAVSVGQVINAGQVIGNVGSTGRSTGPHLHFEVRQGDQPVDPLGALGRTSSGSLS